MAESMTTTITTDSAALLIEHCACANCLHPVNDQGHGEKNGWIHTLTDQYRCSPGYWTENSDLAFADPFDPEQEIDRRIEEAALEGERIGQESGEETGREEALAEHRDECEAKQEAAYLVGRADMNAELNNAITVALHEFYKSGLSRPEIDLIDRMNGVLTAAWGSVEVDAS